MALLKSGQIDEAHAIARGAVDYCLAGNIRWDLHPWLGLARAEILQGDRDAARASLEEMQRLIGETSARYYQPFMHEMRAEFAKTFGDTWNRDDELREAHRRFTELGMIGQAARLS